MFPEETTSEEETNEAIIKRLSLNPPPIRDAAEEEAKLKILLLNDPKKEQLYNFFKNPQATAPFKVKYRLYKSSLHQEFAASFVFYGPETISTKLDELLEQEAKERDEDLYKKLKKLFERQIEKLGLNNPLIIFNDDALCIDIGYSNMELYMLFHGIMCECLSSYHLRMIFLSDSYDVRNYFDECFLNYQYREQLDKERTNLEKDYRRRSDKLPIRTKPAIPQPINQTSIINYYLDHNQGFVLGEAHEYSSSKEFLIDNMPLFRKKGVDTLYMEHLLSSQQAMLDEYFNSPIAAPMPLTLKLYLEAQDKHWGLPSESGFKRVVEVAKANNIRVVAIETDVTYKRNNGVSLRCKLMNTRVAQLIDNYHQNGKYIVFCGRAHASTYDCEVFGVNQFFSNSYCRVLGISELLAIPNITVYDHEEEEFKLNHTEKDLYSGHSSEYDVLYHRKPKRKPYNYLEILAKKLMSGESSNNSKGLEDDTVDDSSSPLSASFDNPPRSSRVKVGY